MPYPHHRPVGAGQARIIVASRYGIAFWERPSQALPDLDPASNEGRSRPEPPGLMPTWF
jgi:hypothetical protein